MSEYRLRITVKDSAQPQQEVTVAGRNVRYKDTKLCYENYGYVDFDVPEGIYDIDVKDDDNARGHSYGYTVDDKKYLTISVRR